MTISRTIVAASAALAFSTYAASASTVKLFEISLSGVVSEATGDFSESLNDRFEIGFSRDAEAPADFTYADSYSRVNTYLGDVSFSLDGYTLSTQGRLQYTEFLSGSAAGRVDLGLAWTMQQIAGGPSWGDNSELRVQYSTFYDQDGSGDHGDLGLPSPSLFEDPSVFEVNGFLLNYTIRSSWGRSSSYYARGTFDTVAVTNEALQSPGIPAVPVPASLPLLGGALLAGGAFARLRKGSKPS